MTSGIIIILIVIKREITGELLFVVKIIIIRMIALSKYNIDTYKDNISSKNSYISMFNAIVFLIILTLACGNDKIYLTKIV